jgi:hypothetical protein
LAALGNSEERLLVFFYVVDFLIVIIQFRIIDKIWTRKKFVQEYEVTILMMVIFFNPLQLTSPCAQNVGVVKDLFMYMVLDQVLTPESKDGVTSHVIQAFIIGMSAYTDPSSYILHLGTILCSTKKSTPLNFVLTVVTMLALMLGTGADFNEQVQNVFNILTLRDHSENIGIYFYISIEVFKKHAEFFKYAYLCFCVIMIFQIRQLIRRGYAVVALCTQTDYEKYERRIFRLRCNYLFLVTFIKVVFN